MPSAQLSKGLLKSLKNIKGEVQNFIKENRLQDLRGQVKKFAAQAQDDLSKMVGVVDKDLQSNVGQLKQKFIREKKQVERLIDRVVLEELKKARNFVSKQKEELQRLQSRLESLAQKKDPSAKKATKTRSVKKTAGKKRVARVAKSL